MPRFVKPTGIAVLLAELATLLIPAPAGAFLYWSNEAPGGPIGRARLDGSEVDQEFIHGDSPEGIATDGTHVFWGNYDEGTIGRAGFDGSEATQSFIHGLAQPYGLAVAGDHIYWTSVGSNKIGRATLTGGDVEPNFISASGPGGIAVANEHIYWANEGTDTIGRAALDGSVLEPSFLSAPGAEGVAVDDGHIYWTDNLAGKIGRSTLLGTDVEASFITGALSPHAIAVDADHVYWTNYTTGTVGRADLDGTDVEEDFIRGGTGELGLAVDSLPHATQTSLRCAPSPLALPASTTCTVMLADVGPFPSAPGPISPTGTVTLSSTTGGAFHPAASCVLDAEAAGRSVCELDYAPSQPGITTVSAVYGGDPAHAGSSGSVALSAEPAAAAPAAANGGAPRPSNSNAFRLGRARLNRRTGTATIPVRVPDAGSLLLTGRAIRRSARTAPGPGALRLALRPTRKERLRLRKAGRAEIRFTIAFTPGDGETASEAGRVMLRLRPTTHRHR